MDFVEQSQKMMDNSPMQPICEVCGFSLDGPILNFGSHPLCDDLVQEKSNIEVPKFSQQIQLCSTCLTAHQLHPVEKKYLFKNTYHYRSGLTNDVLSGMNDLVKSVERTIAIDSETVILDVGCNDGSLLGMFKKEFGCRTIGIDPTDAIKESVGLVDASYQDYFDIDSAQKILAAHGKPDVITFTNVFAHIEGLGELLAAIKILCKPSTLLVIENHYLGSILTKNQFDTFYHEHPRTYSAKSFQFIAKSLEMQIVEMTFPKRYGGNIRVMLSGLESGLVKNLASPSEESFNEDFSKLGEYYESWKSHALSALHELAMRGPLHGKSLPGRAVMLISSLQLDVQIMPMIFEQDHSPKVGFLVPGTRIEIKADSEISEIQPNLLIVWSWHIIDEVCEYLENLGFHGEVWVPLPRFEHYKTI